MTEEKHNIQISDQDISPDDQNLKTDQVNKRHMERRQVLRLGVTGMPMMLSMRASAQSFAHSALDCTVTIPAGLLILVSIDGSAWVTDNVNIRNGRLTLRRVRRIQRRARYTFPPRTVPSEYLPMDVDEDDRLSQFALYSFSGSTTFEPGRFVDTSGNFNIGGSTGLYLTLTIRSTEQGDGFNRMPGASCVISILDYVNQQ